ncbi:MAG: hypothetical protein QOJ25_19 [Solirubrobacteraceae bacterium]|nr:hypothetical protein [Solirubrobacteraceae bacterium]
MLIAAIVVAPAAMSSPRPGTRVTVAVFGDSVTESLLVPNYVQNGLAPQLARAESAFGFTPGGVGLVPAAPFRWHFNHWIGYGSGPVPANGWLMIGYGLTAGVDGPSEYSAVAISPEATATVAMSDPDIEILYSSEDLHCPFTVTSGAHTWTIDPYAPGPPADTGSSLTLPSGRHELTIHGPSCGALWFDGAVARRPVRPGQVQLEVDNLGHSGKLPSDGFTARVHQSLLLQHYDISVFLYAYIAAVIGGQPVSANYLNAMTARARIAREHGGACLIVAPTPLPFPQKTIALAARLDRTAARRAGCTYTTALAHLWSTPAAGERRGLVLIDGVHPTTAGYKLMAHTLAPIIARMARARIRH